MDVFTKVMNELQQGDSPPLLARRAGTFAAAASATHAAAAAAHASVTAAAASTAISRGEQKSINYEWVTSRNFLLSSVSEPEP